MNIEMQPIGFVRTDASHIPRHWTLSDVKGSLVIDKRFQEGLKDVKKNQLIVLISHFHRSPKFTSGFLKQRPPNRKEALGVFSICSPRRPNPIGMSVLKVLEVRGNVIHVQGLDMIDGTPILDIKTHIEDKNSCPSFTSESAQIPANQQSISFREETGVAKLTIVSMLVFALAVVMTMAGRGDGNFYKVQTTLCLYNACCLAVYSD